MGGLDGVRCSRRRYLAAGASLVSASAVGATAGCLGVISEEKGFGADLPYDVDATRSLEEWERYDPAWDAPTTSPLAVDLETEVLVEHLEVPWDLSFANETLFITERVGRVKAIENGEIRTVAEPEAAIDGGSVGPGSDEQNWWIDGGEGGTLGCAAHPGYPDPPLVYVYYTYIEDGNRYNRVTVFDVSADDPNEASWTIVDRIPGEKYHDGGRIEFGPRNRLWITTGDAGDQAAAADPASLAGKILRVEPDGTPADDNPDLGSDADPRVFTSGHRNPQGIAWLPDGTPLATEHGPTPGRDEFQHLVGGDFYGWQAEEIRDPDAYPNADGVHKPLVNTTRHTTFAPTGSLFYTGDRVPSLTNRWIVCGLVSQQLIFTTVTPTGDPLPPVDGGTRYDQDWTDPHYTATVNTAFENRLGRIRHVAQGPDGAVYVITSNRDGRAKGAFPTERDDVLARIVPAE